METTIHIAFCFDASFVPQASVAIFSVLRQVSGPVVIHVLSADLDAVASASLHSLVTHFPQVTLDLVAVSPNRFETIDLTIPYISRETYFRFLLPELLPNVEKVLYLDADLIVLADVREIFEFDMSNAALAGALDSWVVRYGDYASRVLGLDEKDPVVNAGVLLFNLSAMRHEKLDRACIERMAEIVPRVEYQDQDVLNIVCQGRIVTFDGAWNFTMCDWDLHKSRRRVAKIVHFTGPHKPWQIDQVFSRPKASRIWLDERARMEYYLAVGKQPGCLYELQLWLKRRLRI